MGAEAVFLGVKYGRSVKLSIDLRLVSSLRTVELYLHSIA
jgi:hypothetical protein